MEEQQQEQSLPLLATVMILSWNRGIELRRCLEALEASRQRERLQVIVLDPGSMQSASGLQADFPEVTILRFPRNFGATKVLNIGLRSAKAELILFLDPAVIVEPETVAKLAAALEANSDAAAVMPLLVDRGGSPAEQVRKLPDRETLWKVWQDGGAIVKSAPGDGERIVCEYPMLRALLTRLTFLKGMHYFDENYGEWGADLELAYQMRHAGRKAIILSEIRAVDDPAAPQQFDNGQQATFAADRLNGVAHFLGKRAGFVAGLMVRIQAVLVTLLRTLTFQRFGYNSSLLVGLIGGLKIDGSQGKV